MPIPLLNDKKKIEAGHAEKTRKRGLLILAIFGKWGELCDLLLKKKRPVKYAKKKELRIFKIE
jgi:hypothetical protein